MPFAFRFGFRCCTAFFHFHPAAYTHAANVCNAFFTTMRNLPNALRANERATSKNPKVIQSFFSRLRSLILVLVLAVCCSCSSVLVPAFLFLFFFFFSFAFNLLCTNCKTVNARTDRNSNKNVNGSSSSSRSSNNYTINNFIKSLNFSFRIFCCICI